MRPILYRITPREGSYLEDSPMANHASAIKRHKQSVKRNARNRAARTRIKNVVKAVRSRSYVS